MKCHVCALLNFIFFLMTLFAFFSSSSSCRSFDYGDTGPKVCRLSHHSTSTLLGQYPMSTRLPIFRIMTEIICSFKKLKDFWIFSKDILKNFLKILLKWYPKYFKQNLRIFDVRACFWSQSPIRLLLIDDWNWRRLAQIA